MTTHTTDASVACPFTGRRRTVKTGEATHADAPRVEVIDGVWHVRSLPAVREVLRAGRTTTQAGFNSEAVTSRMERRPILFEDGERHRTQRAKLARYFAPKTVSTKYRDFMQVRADELVARVGELGRHGEVELSDVTMRFSVEVAAQVLGLGSADMASMATRLENFFATPFIAPDAKTDAPRGPWSRFKAIGMSMRGTASMGEFFLRDVRPAINARRAERQDDIISHLIDEGYTDSEILIECVTYGAAGMVTTREFIGMAAWHMLDDPALRERYLADCSPEAEKSRFEVLEEILRLEPIVGHLFRRATENMTITDGNTTYDIPAGALLNLYVRAADADPEYVGDDPLGMCPGRELPARTSGEVVAFGDGGHKCPGQFVALQESDEFLMRLLQLPGLRLVSEPVIQWDELIQGYELRNLKIRVG